MGSKDTKTSWVILSAVTFIMFLETAIVKGFSVLLPDLKDQLSSKTWVVGSCISIISGWGYVLGLSANSLVKRFGARFCIMASGLVSSSGLIICANATNVPTLLLGLILSGFMLLEENVAVGILPEYFERHFVLAVTICCSGISLGIIILSPIFTQMCLDIYVWRGAVLMLCGLNLHSIACGALVSRKPNHIEEKPLLSSEENTTSINTTWNKLSRAFGFNLLQSMAFIARVVLPSIVYGCTVGSWLIYIVSYALSNGASMKESAVVATCGGIGNVLLKLALPFVDTIMTYKQLMYVSSIVMVSSFGLLVAFKSVTGMCTASFVYGMSFSTLGTKIYIAAKDVVDEDQYPNAVAWYHVFDGLARIGGTMVTGLIFEATGSFSFSFTFLSVVSLFTALSLWLEEIWEGITKKKEMVRL